jgi:dethiobiotin synthetase
VKQFIFITGTDTAVGKTVLTRLLTQYLQCAGHSVAALKPLCSGGREDAELLHSLQMDKLTLNAINPWHFRAPLTPLIAARIARRKVTLREVVTHIQTIQSRFPIVLIEGAGGLLSPLGEGFDSRDVIQALRAIPIVVCPNRLGAINQVRLVLAALPKPVSVRTQVALVTPRTPELSCQTNIALLQAMFGRERIHVLPWAEWKRPNPEAAIQKTLKRIARNLLPSTSI